MMTKLIKYLVYVWILYSCASLNIFAQEPSYSIVGENVLSGIDIYTLAQDKKGYLWIGTDNGLFKYDGYEFKKISHPNLKAKSIFGLTHDNEDNLFAFNLSGQIISIKDDSLSIFFQIPDSLIASFYDLTFDKNNNLVIIGNIPFWVDKNKIAHIFLKNLPHVFMQSAKSKDNEIYFSYMNGENFDFINYTDSNYQVVKVPESRNPVFILQNKHKNTIIKNRDDFNYYEYNGKQLNYVDLKISKDVANHIPGVAYFGNDNTLWQTTRKGGTVALNKNQKPSFYNHIILKDFFVSAFLEDHENNLWLGTLGKGLLNIPNKNIISYRDKKEIKEEVFTNILNSDKGLFLSTLSGKIYHLFNNKLDVIYNENDSKIDLLKFNNNQTKLIFDGSSVPKMIDLKTNKTSYLKSVGSLKDFDFINDTLAVMATNHNIFFYNLAKNDYTKSNYKTPENIGRTSKVIYHKKNDEIWLSSLKGMMIFSNENEPLIFDSIYPTHFIQRDNLTYVATKNKGIYVFENQNIIKKYDINNYLLSNTVYKIHLQNNTLYISHEFGLQLLDLESEKTTNFDNTNGIFNNKINDFTIYNNDVWLITNYGIQTFNSQANITNTTKPNIIIESIQINKLDTSLFQPFVYHLNYSQNNVNIKFLSTTYRHKGKLKYAYKINELNTGWVYKNFYNNTLELTSLQAGDYTIQIKAINENQIESEPIQLSFIISPPFWRTWWFYAILVFLFILSTYILFKYQIKKQRAKLKLQNELNASKLIAIQSQMNPHFIFNCINSIQDLILQGDIDNSYSYIIKFSKLVRQTLHFSDKEFIDIEDEIELLSIYLDLEKLRFKDDFKFEINTNNIDDIQVPPMLIQPFVENALKHGLLHKEGLKCLTITFKKTNFLSCVVTDNGVGRKKAMEINKRQRKQHQSFSVNATKARFNIMKEQYNDELGIEYIDYNDNKGTEVIIRIPFRQNY